VTFTSGGQALCVAPLTAGTGTCAGAPASTVLATYSGDEHFAGSAYELAGQTGAVGGTVPATLSLTLGTPASFGAFTPGVAADYTAGTTADVVSTAGDAALTVSDPSATAPGHLVNGAFSLPSPLTIGGSPLPAVARTWAAPVAHDPVTVTFGQHVAAGDALRTGIYAKVLTFTLSTTTP
jgi:hypothetical protein